MRKLLLIAALGMALSNAFSQADTVSKPVAPFSIRVNMLKLGVILQPLRPKVEAPYGYGLFYGKPRAGICFAAEIQFFFYDKYGIGLGAESNSFIADTDPGLAAYDGNAHAGYYFSTKPRTNYNCSVGYLELMRRLAAGKFRFEPGIRIGNGKMYPSYYTGNMKQEGTNYWKSIQYDAHDERVWNYGIKASIHYRHNWTEFFYVNAHLNLGFYMSFPTYDVTYTEMYSGQEKTQETFTVKDKLYWFTASFSLNLEWKPEKYR